MSNTDTMNTAPVITADEFESAVVANYEPITEIDWHGLKVVIRRNLPFSSMMEFVDNVVETCFEMNTGAYLPEVKEFAVKCAILEHYGNFVLPVELERRYMLVYASNAVRKVLEHVNMDQFECILSAIDDKVEHRAASNIEAITKQMNEVMAGFNALEDSLSKTFSGIDSDTVSKIADAISNGSFDEKKIVDAFVNQQAEMSGAASAS